MKSFYSKYTPVMVCSEACVYRVMCVESYVCTESQSHGVYRVMCVQSHVFIKSCVYRGMCVQSDEEPYILRLEPWYEVIP